MEKMKYSKDQIDVFIEYNERFYRLARLEGDAEVGIERRVGSLLADAERTGKLLNTSALASSVGVSRTKMRRLIDKWAADGKVKRVKSGASVCIVMTEKRRKFAEEGSVKLIELILECADKIRELK